MLVARTWLILALVASLACIVAEEVPAPQPTQPTPPTRHGPVVPNFDPATATTIDARIVAIPTAENWAPYGSQQSVGAIEVEVFDAGDPMPRMLLWVSCPTDRRGDLFVVGASHVFGLYEREQAWPEVDGPIRDLPVRYVKSVEDSAR